MYEPHLKRSDVLEMSGGLTPNADIKSSYIVKPGGEIIIPKRRFFSFSKTDEELEPGDILVVPLNTKQDSISGLPLVAEVSTIIYQMSLGAAAIKSFNSN